MIITYIINDSLIRKAISNVNQRNTKYDEYVKYLAEDMKEMN